jgi:hypothetical protein
MLCVATASVFLYLVAVQLAFDSGIILALPDPLLALGLGIASSVAADALVQRRQLRNLQEVFDLLPSPIADFFISYRRGQSELAANTLREGLARKFGEQRGVYGHGSDRARRGLAAPHRRRHPCRSCSAGGDWTAVAGGQSAGQLAPA